MKQYRLFVMDMLHSLLPRDIPARHSHDLIQAAAYAEGYVDAVIRGSPESYVDCEFELHEVPENRIFSGDSRRAHGIVEEKDEEILVRWTKFRPGREALNMNVGDPHDEERPTESGTDAGPAPKIRKRSLAARTN